MYMCAAALLFKVYNKLGGISSKAINTILFNSVMCGKITF